MFKSEELPLLQNIVIKCVRNISSAELNSLKKINIIYGRNGSGKTSVLEAINILGLARSFRTAKFNAVIKENEDFCMVHGTLTGRRERAIPVGVIRKRNKEFLIKIDGQKTSSIHLLAERIPIQILNSDTFQILEGGPIVRRKFLDWGVFHVEQEFNHYWRRLMRALKQRNEALRHAKIRRLDAVRLWDKEILTTSKVIDGIRENYFAVLEKNFSGINKRLIGDLDVEIEYFPGWDKRKGLEEHISEKLEIDLKRGFTSVGAHRATFDIKNGKNDAKLDLSRGQQKLAVASLVIAHGLAVNEMSGKHLLYLVDDLPAELDDINLSTLLLVLIELDFAQIFITCINVDTIISKLSIIDAVKLFHVKHGEVVETVAS